MAAMVALAISATVKRSRARRQGFENVSQYLRIKNGVVYYLPGENPDHAVPVEVVGVREITQNARLVQLEIRYRVNGEVRSEIAKGGTNELLTIEDKIGYGG